MYIIDINIFKKNYNQKLNKFISYIKNYIIIFIIF